ncbi:MAG: DUF349 domain-containing protein [Bacteroidota bacterium]
MEKVEFLERIKTLAANEDVMAVNTEINELKSKFQDFLIEEERKIQVTALESQLVNAEDSEGLEVIHVGSNDTENEIDSLKEEFFAIYSEFRTRKTAFTSAQKLEQEAHLRLKQNLIERLRKLIQHEENIGVAVSTYKEIHEAWKNVGDIPREKRQDIQNEYSKLLESFFFNLKIYRELKEHDLKRNSQLKRELIDKIKALFTVESIKEIETAIKALQNEFDEIGPVVNDEWEQIKTSYWEAVKAIYARIHEFYEGKREELKSNIDKKAALLEEVKTFVSTIEAYKTTKEWEDKTHELLTFQDKWKEIGFGTKKENEELWTSFREECNAFFDKKKVFYDGLKAENEKIASVKRALIEKANKLKESKDWKETTQALVKLQQDWKTLGNAGQKLEQALWREFRGACDSFFNSKQKHFEEADKNNEQNLTLKLDLISKIESYVPTEDKRKTLDDLRDFSAAFNAIGNVPFKEKDKIYTSYKSAIDSHYSKLKLEGAERDKVHFQAKIDSLKANPNSEKLIDREKRDMHNQIATLKHEIMQFENNLGFFANSKGADALKKEVETKINAAKRKIEDLQKKLKQI